MNPLHLSPASVGVQGCYLAEFPTTFAEGCVFASRDITSTLILDLNESAENEHQLTYPYVTHFVGKVHMSKKRAIHGFWR